MANDETRPVKCWVLREGTREVESRELVAEEPLLVLLDGEAFVTLMRTPGCDRELVAGHLLSEGLIRSLGDIGVLSECPDAAGGEGQSVTVTLTSEARERAPEAAYRQVLSSCGVCTARIIEAVERHVPPFTPALGSLQADDIFDLADEMAAGQELFRRTGATHAAALATPGTRDDVLVREDLGRHNAMDKAIGAALLRGRSPEGGLIMLSGRISCEMVAKAARARIPVLAGVSAPSSLAVQLADRLNMVLAGFVRGRSMTVYAGADVLARS